MERAALLAAFALGGLFFVPYSDSFFKFLAGLVVLTLGLATIYAVMNDDVGRARSSLLAAFGLIVLIETLSPLDWRVLIK